ncbi:MAG: recombinase family protein [Firmicutes bacterium]|nr:recombinase family protein [Bacillota bacterium]
MLAIIYTRVSTEEKARHGFSLEGQERDCRKKAQELGATRIEVYCDAGVTGEILERPALQAALAAAKSGATWFIVYDPDRLSRKLAHQLLLSETIERYGCRLEFVNFEWQDTPEGRLFYSLRGAIAEYEKEKIKVRTQFGKKIKAQRGLLTHHFRLYGYKYENGGLVVDQEKADVYHLMCDMALAGSTPPEIADYLNSLGIIGPLGGKWYRNTIRRILSNPSYLGTVFLNRYNTEGNKAARQKGEKRNSRIRPRDEWIPVPIPVLIDKEKWDRIQINIKERKEGRRDSRYNVYLLSGILYCECGSQMHGTTNGNKRRYYVCCRRHFSGSDYRKAPERCGRPFIRAEEAEEIVWDKIKTWLGELETMLIEARQKRVNEAKNREMDIAARRMEELSQEKERVFTAYRRGLIDLDDFERAVEDINSARKSAEVRLKELSNAVEAEATLEQEIDLIRELAHSVAERLDDLEASEKEYLIHTLVKKALVRGTEIILEVKIPLKEKALRDETTILGEVPTTYLQLMLDQKLWGGLLGQTQNQ